jgi:hypothetical protein
MRPVTGSTMAGARVRCAPGLKHSTGSARLQALSPRSASQPPWCGRSAGDGAASQRASTLPSASRSTPNVTPWRAAA